MSLRDGDLPALTADLGLPGIVDVHVHFMAPPILAKVWAYFDAAGPMLGRPWPITYRWTDEERVAHLRSMGVRRFSALSYAHRPGVAGFMNEWTLDFADRTPDALRSATFYPEPEAATYVPQLVEDGVEVFKVHVQVGDFAPDDPLLDPVWGVLAESGTPIVLHAGSGPAPGKHTGPEGVEHVLSRHPGLALVIAHLGMPEIDDFLDLAERHDNVRLDTTMAFVDFWEQPVPAHLPPRLLGLQDKILFGTDFPNIPYEYAHQVEVLQRLDLGDDWMRSVLWHNGAELFSVTP
ncbi:amidohydrolase family protein [Aeromicrobium wangtongii]|uniref:Amidohydrolase n=1 Tax=Aeromicrobium wangtongii TaxID=2969247 RepID=A0ABY5MCH3_9ACTN|nr:amidohydrolase family protein [Aeromicrobium wangtongii]MCD9197126.1 amidohydrolase [Aeromicrobium wangtongii]UUP14624.1 amidohydrolase [Aeromicrobium wangtongii]